MLVIAGLDVGRYLWSSLIAPPLWIDSGPYLNVRHPGYTGAIPYLAFAGLALGSWRATVLAGIPMIAMHLHRTVLEGKMLRKGLVGYEVYATRVKYRVLPGIW